MATKNGQVRDINEMTDAEIEVYRQQRKAQQAKLVAEKGKEARADVEKYLQSKWGLTLAQVWMANQTASQPKTYRNPANGQTYVYSGRGKVPVWLQDHNKKPNAAYLVQTN
jgi:H-NS histone family